MSLLARRQGGFTIMELVIATSIALLVLFLAMDSMRVSLKSIAVMGDETQLRGRQWPVTLLRRDVRRATSLGTESLEWTEGSLTLITDAGTMIYRRTRQRTLIRTFHPASGGLGDSDEAVILRRASRWRWRSLPGGLVQIELGVRTDRATGATTHGHRKDRVESLLLMRRAGTRVARW